MKSIILAAGRGTRIPQFSKKKKMYDSNKWKVDFKKTN